MPEEYIESILIRQDNKPEVETPMFTDDELDENFEFEGIVTLRQIVKSVQNKTHNRHDYVFKIKTITKLEKQGS